MNSRTIESVEEIRSILTDPQWRVRPEGNEMPDGLRDSLAGEIFAAFARMSDGDDHVRRKQKAVDVISTLDLQTIPEITHNVLWQMQSLTPGDVQYLVPGLVLTGLLDTPEADRKPLVEHVRALVTGSRPTATQEDCARAISATERAVPVIAGTLDFPHCEDIEFIASRISLLFQASDACAALIGNALVAVSQAIDLSTVDAVHVVIGSMDARVPVRSTTRVRGNELAILDLEGAHRQYPNADWTFGFGPHSCPGRSIAIAIAVACIAWLLEKRPFDLTAVRRSGWEQLPNVWIPILSLEKGVS